METQGAGALAGPRELVAGGKVLGPRIPTNRGMVCLVCNRLIGPHDFVFLVSGQRVAVHRAVCYPELLRHPDQFLAALQPHGAFLGAGGENQKMSFPWFLVGVYVLAGLLFAGLCAHRALQRGQNPAAWFGVGMVLNLIGYLLLLTCSRRKMIGVETVPRRFGKVVTTRSPRACPECGVTNHPAAEECTGCGKRLEPSIESEVTRIAAP